MGARDGTLPCAGAFNQHSPAFCQVREDETMRLGNYNDDSFQDNRTSTIIYRAAWVVSLVATAVFFYLIVFVA